MQNTNEPSLKREIGAFGIALNAINLTVGAGIFVLPALIAENLGAAAFIAYIINGILILLIMLCYAEIGTKVIEPGGSYAYVEKAFGPFPGFLINTLFWFGYAMLADAAVINAMTDMLAVWFPVFSIFYVRTLFFILIFSFLAFINVRGVKSGSLFAVTVTIVKLTPLILLVLIGFSGITTSNLHIASWPGIKSLGEATLLLFFAFGGTESALNLSGEIKNPKKNIPSGIFLGVAGILMIYLLIQFIAQGVLGSQLVLEKKAPLASIATQLIGPIGGTIILATGVISMFGMISSDILLQPRLLYAASKDKLLPGFLAKTHRKFASPYWAIIVYALMATILSASTGFKELALLGISAVLIIYASVLLAMIRLRYKKEGEVNGSFRVPFGLTIPVLAIAVIAWLLSHITGKEIKVIAIFFALLTIIYFINKLVRKKMEMQQPE